MNILPAIGLFLCALVLFTNYFDRDRGFMPIAIFVFCVLNAFFLGLEVKPWMAGQ